MENLVTLSLSKNKKVELTWVSFSADHFESLSKCTKKIKTNKKIKNQFSKETNEGFIGISFVNSEHKSFSMMEIIST